MDAGLGKLVSKVCITPMQLCLNLGGQKLHAPEDPGEEPAGFACDYVIEADKYGFREAAAVLEGARQMAAKELAAEPVLRRYIRELHFMPHACLTATMTKKGETSADEYHREFARYREEPVREIEDEDFLWIMRAARDDLLDVKVGLTEDRQQRVLDELFKVYKSDNANPSAYEWNKFREDVMKEALTKTLYKVLEQNLVDLRITQARAKVGRAVTSELERLLRVPPYQCQKSGGDSKRVKPDRIMACSFGNNDGPTEFVVIDKFGEVIAFKSIRLDVSRNHNNLMADFRDHEYNALRSFFSEQSPDVVVLGADGLQCRSLHTQLTRACDRFHTEGALPKAVEVLLADQRVAYLYANSTRANAEFPRYTPTRLKAVSLARRLQDPLREFSGLCAGVGEEVLSLHLHPLQDTLQKGERLKAMHRAFINVVNEVGVNINLAADKPLIHGHLVQFVSGLGPRKARELLRIISKNLYVEHRAAMLEDTEIRAFMREVVWYNCAGFLNISKEGCSMWTKNYNVGQTYNYEEEQAEYVKYAGGPLEGTRVHPESYTYARAMASEVGPFALPLPACSPSLGAHPCPPLPHPRFSFGCSFPLAPGRQGLGARAFALSRLLPLVHSGGLAGTELRY
jgi:transcription elongation factor SPT6